MAEKLVAVKGLQIAVVFFLAEVAVMACRDLAILRLYKIRTYRAYIYSYTEQLTEFLEAHASLKSK
jgi:hypothetical protein